MRKMAAVQLNLVVAACKSGGIGKDGKLPWRLRKDMDFFKLITSQTNHSDKQNVVIMGRKTWCSIPEKFRPLKNRINIVLSKTMDNAPKDVLVAPSLEEAVRYTQEEINEKVESIFVIGGSSVYAEAMKDPWKTRVYLTRVLANFDCDVFLPDIDENKFKKVEGVEHVPIGTHTEKDIDFVFEVYNKIQEL